MNQSKRLLRSGLGPDRVWVSPEAGGFERACRDFKMAASGILHDLRLKRFALSPSEARRAKEQRALARRLKAASDLRRKNRR